MQVPSHLQNSPSWCQDCQSNLPCTWLPWSTLVYTHKYKFVARSVIPIQTLTWCGRDLIPRWVTTYCPGSKTPVNGVLQPHSFKSLLPHQRVNHFPRSYELTRKDRWDGGTLLSWPLVQDVQEYRTSSDCQGSQTLQLCAQDLHDPKRVFWVCCHSPQNERSVNMCGRIHVRNRNVPGQEKVKYQHEVVQL